VARVLADVLRERAPAVVIASRILPPEAERKSTAGIHADSATLVKTTVDVTVDSAASAIVRAVRAAMHEPPGPVWLTVEPALLTQASTLFTQPSSPAVAAEREAPTAIDARQVDAVADRLAACERPIILAGRECRAPGTAGWLRAFAESVPAPVLVTPAARGVLPDPHPLAFGLLRADAAVLARADLIVALGMDDEEATCLTQATPMLRLGRGGGAAARGDVPALLEELAPRLRGRVRADWDVAELDRLRRAIPAPAVDPALAELVTRVRDATPAGTAIVFPRALEPLAALWQAVGPGEVVIAHDVTPAGIAVALARPENATLVLAREDDAPLAELAVAVATRARVVVLALDGGAVDAAAVRTAGARIVRPLSLPALEAALGGALIAPVPSVIARSNAG